MSAMHPEDKYIKVGDINTRYWSAGDKGSAVILVHGLGGFIENWVHNINALAEKHCVYAPDLLGFGRTDKTPLIRDITFLAKFISDFMDLMKIEKASLVGNSMGGGLVLQFAVDYPDKVAKLVLVDNAGMGRDVIADFKICSLPILGELLVRQSRKATVSMWRKIVYDATLITPELIDVANGIIIQPGAKKALLAALRAGIDTGGQRSSLLNPLLSKLGSLKAPTLVVWGKEDKIIPLKHARIAATKIAGARLEIFDKCGHMPMFEYPDKFNKLVLDFLAQ